MENTRNTSMQSSMIRSRTVPSGREVYSWGITSRVLQGLARSFRGFSSSSLLLLPRGPSSSPPPTSVRSFSFQKLPLAHARCRDSYGASSNQNSHDRQHIHTLTSTSSHSHSHARAGKIVCDGLALEDVTSSRRMQQQSSGRA